MFRLWRVNYACCLAFLAGLALLSWPAADAAAQCCGGGARPGEGSGGRPPGTVVRPPLPPRPNIRDIINPTLRPGETGGSGSSSGSSGGAGTTGSTVSGNQIPGPDFNQAIEQAIRDGAGENAGRDTVWSRVFGNLATLNWPQSCVEASESRATDVANAIKQAIKDGKINLDGRTIKVGTRSAWDLPESIPLVGGSWHTYTAIELVGPDGKSQGTWDVDTYVIPIVNVDGPKDMFPPSPAAWDPLLPTSAGDTPHHTITGTKPKK